VSFINAVAEVCELGGADVAALAQVMSLDERIGRRNLRAGTGFGGGCLPKDLRTFAGRAAELGATRLASFFTTVDEINTARRERMVMRSRGCWAANSPAVA
jgi:UDPglucose 6-dehydrogenase